MTPDDEISRHLGLVRRQALLMARRLPPSVTVDELAAAGVVGLWQAVERFDAGRGVPFAAYARRRIQGEMLDYLRSLYGRGCVVTEELPTPGPACYLDTLDIDRRRLIETEIAALPPRWAETVRAWLRGESGAELARREGVSQPTVVVRKSRAFAAMRQSLEARGVTLAACV